MLFVLNLQLYESNQCSLCSVTHSQQRATHHNDLNLKKQIGKQSIYTPLGGQHQFFFKFHPPSKMFRLSSKQKQPFKKKGSPIVTFHKIQISLLSFNIYSHCKWGVSLKKTKLLPISPKTEFARVLFSLQTFHPQAIYLWPLVEVIIPG